MVSVKNAKNKIYFIDYENILKFEPSKKSEENIKLIVFLGALQNHVSVDMVMKLHNFTTNIEFVKMANQGKNCLDFHLCYKMGELNKTTPELVEFIVLSKDKGFDNIVKHVKSLGRLCKRKENFES